MMRVLVPARLRKAVRAWFDSRYISIADHRQDIRDALWEVQTLRREMTTLQAEVERLRNARSPVTADKAKIDDTHRLAQETAKALDGVLQNEVLVWQAIDDLRARATRSGTGSAVNGPAGHPEQGMVRPGEGEERPCA
jgi:FtsZ-binding cell division protein ZapB